MKITRRTTVSIETERRLTAPVKSSGERVYCPQCAAPMLAAQTVADFFRVSSRAIYRFIEAGKIHFAETATNEIYVCPVSLKKSLETD